MSVTSTRESKGETLTLIFLLLISMIGMCNVLLANTAIASMTWIVRHDGLGLSAIQQAIDVASDGDTILVLPGTYYEHLVVNKRLSIIGEDQSSTIVDGNDTWTAVTIQADDTVFRNFTIQHGGQGVKIAAGAERNMLSENTIMLNSFYGISGDRCGENVIANNNISLNAWDGIYLYASEPCIIENNSILSNGNNGLFLRYSNDNRITGNLVAGNVAHGVYIYSDADPLREGKLSKNNMIRSNHFLNNSCGVEINHYATDSSLADNEICQNYIAYNDVGLKVSGSHGNVIYHNNFVNNSNQLFTNDSSNNNWNGDYYTGGNYWSDHNSIDLYWGFDQNEAGSDGIADIPYTASENPREQDKYPFSHANEWLSPPEVSIVSPSNTTYRPNKPLALNLTMNKPVYLCYSLDNQPNVTVASNLILVFNFTIGLHNITVYANDTAGNMASSETPFTTTFLGDINMDRTINIVDIVIVASCYASMPGTEKWNSDADLDNNMTINIVDVTLATVDYGKTL